DRVENVLEGSGGQGTLAQYMRLWPFDLREKNPDPAVGFSRSTSGLANTNLSTSADIEIRMLFAANTTTRGARVPLPTESLPDSRIGRTSCSGPVRICRRPLSAFGPACGST